MRRETIRIVVQSTQEKPAPTVRRKLGAMNVGVYCKSDACKEFIALATDFAPDTHHNFILDTDPIGALIWIRCPMCLGLHSYQAPDAAQVFLTERSKRAL